MARPTAMIAANWAGKQEYVLKDMQMKTLWGAIPIGSPNRCSYVASIYRNMKSLYTELFPMPDRTI